MSEFAKDMKTFIEIVSEVAEEEGLVHLSAEIKLKLDDEHLELLQKAADMYAELSNSQSAEGAAVGNSAAGKGVRVGNGAHSFTEGMDI